MPATTLIDRALIRLSGADVRGFLQGLVTNDLALLAADKPLWAGLLTPQGKALFDFMLWADGEDVLVDCERDAAGALARRLTMYRLRRVIAITREENLCVHWRLEPPPFGLSLSKPSPSSETQEEGSEVLRQAPDERSSFRLSDPRLADLGCRWLAPEDDPATGWHSHRLSLGVTEGVGELGSDKTLWLECNAIELNGVSFTKGCYVGQENTARMHHRSKVGRRLVVVPTTVEGPRTRVIYPELKLAVEHRRIDDLEGVIKPDWLTASQEISA